MDPKKCLILILLLLNQTIGSRSLHAYDRKIPSGDKFTSLRQPQSETDCRSLDLRPQFGPPRTQGNVGWCYANATADLISYHYRHELEQPASAIAIALNFNYHWLADNMREGGFMFLALQNTFRTGVCPQYFDQEIMTKGKVNTLREKLNFILNLKEKLDNNETEYVYDQIISSQNMGSVLNHFKPYDLMTIMAQSKKTNVLSRISESLCGKHRHHFKKSAKVNWSTKYLLNTKSRIFENLNRALDQDTPAGIAYFAGFFEDDHAPRNSSNRHMSVVVGRKFNYKTSSCEYLVRNSYGSHCRSYTNPRFKDKCESGHLWVDGETLKDNLYGVTYLTEN